jgi:phage terminase small subunit
MAFTDKQQAFIREYLVDFNATQAAIRAGYSERSARSIGAENLAKPDILAAIREQVTSADEVLVRLTDIARGDMADLMDITPSGFTFRLLLKDENGERVVNPKTKLIKKIKQKVTTFLSKSDDGEDREIIETELELYSAHEALRDLGKYHKLFVERSELSGPNGGPVETKTIGDEGHHRAISALADAIRESISGARAAADGDLGSAKQAPVAGVSFEG